MRMRKPTASLLTAKFVLHPRQRNDGSQQARLRLTKDRNTVFFDPKVYVFASGWNSKSSAESPRWIRGRGKDFDEQNEELQELLFRVYYLREAYPNLSAKEVRDRLITHPSETLDDIKKVIEANKLKLDGKQLGRPLGQDNFNYLLWRIEHMTEQMNLLNARVARLTKKTP